MSKSNEYWQQRALKREDETFARGAELTARLFKECERAAREIRKQVNDFYARYATENGISFDEAVKNLNRSEKQEWKESLGRWVKRINEEQNEAIKAMLKAELDALSYNSQINRLEALYGQIQMILNELFSVGVQQMQEAFGDMFEEAYYKKVYDIQQRVGFINEFAKINESMIQNIVSYPWSGADFSKRLWENKRVLHFHVRETITQGLIQGKGVPQMTKDLSDRMGSSFKNAERLIRTETSHFHNEATKTAYRTAGVKEYEYMATLDNRTSSVCKGLDGKHFKLSEAKTGVNYPPMHPWCRSTTVEYDPHDALDWYNSGEPMPENMTYEEWYESEVEEKGIERVEAEEKKIKNRAADMKQLEDYKKVLGKEAPKTIKEFQEIKYNQQEEWNDLELMYTNVNRYKVDLGHVDAKTIFELDKIAFESKWYGFDFKKYHGKEREKVRNLRRSGNAAAMQFGDEVYFSYSAANRKGKIEYDSYVGSTKLIGMQDNPKYHTFEVDGDGINRVHDTEAKFLEWAATQLNTDSNIVITILSEKDMCDSCKGVAEQFKRDFPHVTLNVVSGKGKKDWKGRKGD